MTDQQPATTDPSAVAVREIRYVGTRILRALGGAAAGSGLLVLVAAVLTGPAGAVAGIALLIASAVFFSAAGRVRSGI